MPFQREFVFDSERRAEGEEPEEDSGPRSILKLDRIVFGPALPPPSAEPRKPPPQARFDSTQSVEEEDSEEESGPTSILKLERIRFVPAVSREPTPAIRARPAEPRSNPLEPAPPPSATRRRDPLSLSQPPPPGPEIEVPQFEHDLEPVSVRPIPVERAVLLSLGLHILLFLVLRWAPSGGTGDPRRGLLGAFLPEPKPPDTIPLVFRSAPGPERANPNRSDPSDKARRAGGGDASRPRSESPFVPEKPGIEGLAPGSGKSARAAPPRRPAAGDNGERTAAARSEAAKSSAPEAFLQPPLGPTNSGRPGQPLTNLDAAIRDAAREVGGEGGAGLSNPEGGFVDSGPISFDTSWYDWGAYAEEMVRRIKLHWEIPELARLGWKGRLTVRFFIMADGRVADAKYISHSGVPPFDFAALNAILKSDPFRPLPRDLLAQVPGKDREGITVTFFYNLRPPRE